MNKEETELTITISREEDKELWFYLKTISKNNPKDYLRRAVKFLNSVSGTEQTYLGNDSPEAYALRIKNCSKEELLQKKIELEKQISGYIEELIKQDPEDLGIMVGPEPELYSVDEDSILGWIVLNHLYLKELEKKEEEC